MNRKNKLDKILFIYFIVLAIASLVLGKFFITGNEMGYSVLFFYILMPASSFITNLLSSMLGGMMKYLFLLVYPIFGVALPIIVFTAGYQSLSLYFGLIPAVVGFIIGTFAKMMRNMKENKKYMKK